MKVCLQCGGVSSAATAAEPCPECGSTVEVVDGVPCFAPALAYESPGFNPQHFAQLAQLEDGNFWFKARNELIIHVLRKYFPRARSLLEIGCGTGYVLRGITRACPWLHGAGSEIFLDGLAFASQRLPGTRLFQMDARQIPYDSEFDVIGAFDVVEHIEEDEQVLRQIHRALKPGGGAILTVPQHPALWSSQDERACHVRRYRRNELTGKLQAAGFRVVFSTSFVSFLLPLLAASRGQAHKGSKNPASHRELNPPGPLNALLYQVLHLEIGLIRAGVRFPAGGTRLVAAVKPTPAPLLSARPDNRP